MDQEEKAEQAKGDNIDKMSHIISEMLFEKDATIAVLKSRLVRADEFIKWQGQMLVSYRRSLDEASGQDRAYVEHILAQDREIVRLNDVLASLRESQARGGSDG